MQLDADVQHNCPPTCHHLPQPIKISERSEEKEKTEIKPAEHYFLLNNTLQTFLKNYLIKLAKKYYLLKSRMRS